MLKVGGKWEEGTYGRGGEEEEKGVRDVIEELTAYRM